MGSKKKDFGNALASAITPEDKRPDLSGLIFDSRIPQIVKFRDSIIFTDVRNIEINELNKGFDEIENDKEFEELKADVKARGVLVPCIVSPLPKGKFKLYTGHRRLRAAIEVGLPQIPVQVVSNKLDDDIERELIIKDNLQRRQLTKENKKALLKFYFPDEINSIKRGGDRTKGEGIGTKISAITGISTPTITRLIREIISEEKAKHTITKTDNPEPPNKKTFKEPWTPKEEETLTPKQKAELATIRKEITIINKRLEVIFKSGASK
jgi:ParB/RepB/Spo0J family partition protein